jgi:hypothetical protein
MGTRTSPRVVAAITGALVTTALVTTPALDITAAATTATRGAVSRTASLPRPADVVRGRVVAPITLDDGVFTVVPAPADDRPRVSQKAAVREIWASPVLQGHEEGPLGYGLVTISLRVSGVPRVTKLPAWVGFARSSGIANCPVETATSTSSPGDASGTALPSSGYAAVVIGAAQGSPAVTYTARSVLCGSAQPPALALASEVLSEPWQSVAGVKNDSIIVRATLPACGQLEGIDSGGSTKVWTVTVAAVVPDVHGRCDGTREITRTVDLGPVGNPPGAPPPLVSASTRIRHGTLGPSVVAVAPTS